MMKQGKPHHQHHPNRQQRRRNKGDIIQSLQQPYMIVPLFLPDPSVEKILEELPRFTHDEHNPLGPLLMLHQDRKQQQQQQQQQMAKIKSFLLRRAQQQQQQHDNQNNQWSIYTILVTIDLVLSQENNTSSDDNDDDDDVVIVDDGSVGSRVRDIFSFYEDSNGTTTAKAKAKRTAAKAAAKNEQDDHDDELCLEAWTWIQNDISWKDFRQLLHQVRCGLFLVSAPHPLERYAIHVVP